MITLVSLVNEVLANCKVFLEYNLVFNEFFKRIIFPFYFYNRTLCNIFALKSILQKTWKLWK